jgi:hypothetical protein
MGNKESFLDGCHKYGWIINILVTVFLAGIAWGSINTSVDDIRNAQNDLKERITRVENILLCGSVVCK